MPDFFADNPDIHFNLERLDLRQLADLLEGDYSDAREFDYAPEDSADAFDNYVKVCEIAGVLCGNSIAERAREVDLEGNVFQDGEVTYHPLVVANLLDFKRAQLMGISLPRRYGGLNMPQAVKTAVLEILSRADASFMNLVGLQDIAETINEFGTEEQKEKYIPRLATGDATGAMVLTEPDSGSDLQSIRLKAIPPEDRHDNEVWHLMGMKRFITNGCGDILLVQARSEEGTTDARGISLFVCEKDDTIHLRRIEDKLGIHGSPTCEMMFNNTPAYLIGKRRLGLIKYVMSLMNGARLGIAAQALGIAEAAYRTARKYAETRVQFGKTIIEIPPVYEMLTNMRVQIEASRVLLYESAKVVDLFKIPERRIQQNRERGKSVDPEIRKHTKYYERLASVLTPFSKYHISEMCNRITYDGIQVMGGSGFMKDYNMERYYRDARITTIYEGTSQMQIVGAIGGLLAGALNQVFDKFCEHQFPSELKMLTSRVKKFVPLFYDAVDFVKQKRQTEFTNLVARRLVDMAIDTYISILLTQCAQENDRKATLAELWIHDADLRVRNNRQAILSGQPQAILEKHQQIM